MDIFVGSLSFKLKESELREAFEKYGSVSSAKIIIDKITRQSKGFGFVEMPDDDEARLAINSLNGQEMYGRALVVNESQKREPRTNASGGGIPRSNSGRDDFSSRPKPAEGDRSFPPREKSAPGSSAGDSRPGNSGFGADRYKSSDKKPGGGNDRGGYGDKGRPRSDNRFGKPSDHKKGGGGSKNFKSLGDDDSDSWY